MYALWSEAHNQESNSKTAKTVVLSDPNPIHISGKPFTPSGKATKQRDDAPKATYAKRLLHDIRLTAASAGVGALLMHPVRQ